MAHAEHQTEHYGHQGQHHIIPKKVLFSVFAALVTLTILTVLTAQLDLGSFNIPLAIGIAMMKAGLVLAFFMALKYDKSVNTLTFVVGGIFVVVFLAFTLFDTAFRGDIGNVDTMTVKERQTLEEELQAREPNPDAVQMIPSGAPSVDSERADTGATAETPAEGM